MDAGQWKRIREIFDAAVEQPDPEMRRRLVHSLCDHDTELIREVESLLETDARAEHFLEVPAAEAALFPAAAAPALPMKLGAYRLLEEAGRGGMADVYRAERADGQFSKQVAIKLLRGGIYGDDIRKRFHRERQVLAELNHPNIVRLWDGGVTDDGRPYLVEDFVEGPPITEWARGRNLDRESRLRLFLFVCDAVAYAHERGVIHRDIKPGNILTTNEGAPMLVDFGIAGLIEPGAAEPGGTQTLVRYWTPEYASPEQSRGEPAGRPSDVYSLGAVLYELLLERRPYRVDGLPPHEVTRIICEQEPDWNGLDRRLRAVVRKSLAKDTAARYAGAQELANDLRRYLARQKTVAERLPAPAKGRRVAMAAAAVLMMLLAAAGYRIWSQRTYTVKLDHVPGKQALPSLSPDGAEVAFQWTLDGQGGIGVMGVDGKRQRWITRNQPDCCAKWSPDGRMIGFLREWKRDRFELMVIRPDGSGERRVTEIAGISMDWNRDSTQLAVAHRRHRDEPFGIFLVDVSTGRLRRLTAPPAGYYGDIAVAAVPSGGWVLARYQSPGNGILMRSDEFGGLQALTTEPTWAIGPVVHPNEKEVLLRAAYNGRSGIWRIPLGGG
ncbi:MAG: protein kinase, partial [Bryobacteraceae bacterium]|nr:protein kinase [Bryobacteraceae bacterium]